MSLATTVNELHARPDRKPLASMTQPLLAGRIDLSNDELVEAKESALVEAGNHVVEGVNICRHLLSFTYLME